MQDADCKREENLYKLNKGYWDLYKLSIFVLEFIQAIVGTDKIYFIWDSVTYIFFYKYVNCQYW